MDVIIGQNNWIRGVGTFVSNSDGITHISSVGLGADVSAIEKEDGTVETIGSNSWYAVDSMSGHFDLLLTNSNCDQGGQIKISIVDSSFHLPIFMTLENVTSAYYALKYGSVEPALASAVSSVQAKVDTLPNSEALNAHILTLPTSEGLSAEVAVLPTSEGLSSEISALPTSASLRAEIIVLPTSAVLRNHILTMPTSEALNDLITPLATEANVDAKIATLPTSSVLRNQILTMPTSEAVRNIADASLVGIRLDHLMQNSSALSDVADFSIVARMLGRNGTADNFVSSDDSLQGLAEGASAGGASQSEVQSACYQVIDDIRLDHLMVNSSALTDVSDFSIIARMLSRAGDPTTFVSSDDSLQGIREGASGGGASQSEVQSACYNAMADISLNTLDGDVSSVQAVVDALPTSETLHTQIITLPDSGALRDQILTLPTSGALRDQILTLPDSGALRDQILTLPTSETQNDQMAVVFNGVSSVDVRVSSISAQIETLPNSEALNIHMLTLPTSEGLSAEIGVLPTSSVLRDQILTLANSATLSDLIGLLPTSEGLSAEIATLPTSEALNAHILTMPTSSVLREQILTMPTSESLNAHMITMPDSATLSDLVATLPTSSAMNLMVASDFFGKVIDGSIDFIETQRLVLSAFTGQSSGGGTGTFVYMDNAGTKTRFTMQVDSASNRIAVTIGDLS